MTFIFNGNGATGGAVPDPAFWMDPDGWVGIPNNENNLTRIGYTFIGWAGSKNTTTPDLGVSGSAYTIGIIPGIYLIRDILSIVEDWGDDGNGFDGYVLYAVWKAMPPVAVTYNGNGNTGGSAPVDNNSPYQYGSTITVLGQGTLTKTNNKFLGWATTSGATLAQYAQDSKFTITNNTTLYAVWGPTSTPMYTVTYNGNGNTGGNAPVDNNSYSQGVLVTVKANPGGLVKAGCNFLGWHTNSAAATPAFKVNNFSVTPPSFNIQTSNMVFYAVWEPIQYCTVTYSDGGSTDGVPPVDVNSPYVAGSNVVVLGRGTLFRLHDTFLGWSIDVNVPPFNEGDSFTITEDTVLYPVWDPIPSGSILSPVVYNANWPGGVAGSGSVPVDPTFLYPPGVKVTVLGNTGNLSKAGYIFVGWSPSKTALSPTYTAGSTFNMSPNTVTLYAVWNSSGGGGGSGGTIVVPFDGRQAGANGSKQTTLKYQHGYPTIMQVAANLPNDADKSAVIENLVIDGLNLSNNATGILLENVCSCLIRNVTIMNCEVGIRVKLTGANGSFSRNNRFEHVRMINVKTGILFEGTSSAKDFSYTTIEDVGVSLAGNSTDAGIKVGNGNIYANLYGAFVKVNVWLNGSSGKGLEVNGQIKGSFVNLAVIESGNNSGRCIVLNANAVISTNQSFLLAVLGVANNIVNNGGSYSGVKIVP